MRLRDVSATQGDAGTFLSDLWFAGTARVEVLQGAGASLYGTNAIGGVVNMVTDQGGGPFHGDIDLQGGMLSQFLERVHLAGGVRNRLFYSAGFGHVEVANGVNGNGQYRNTGGLGSLEYLPKPAFRIGTRIIGAGTFGQLQDNPIPLPPTVTSAGAINAVALPLSQIPAAVASISAGTPFNFGNATFIPAYGDPDDYRVVRFISTLLYAEHEILPNLHYRLNFRTSIPIETTSMARWVWAINRLTEPPPATTAAPTLRMQRSNGSPFTANSCRLVMSSNAKVFRALPTPDRPLFLFRAPAPSNPATRPLCRIKSSYSTTGCRSLCPADGRRLI